MRSVYALLRSMRDQTFSRNRNFAEHDTAEAARARRLHRLLRAIESDLKTAKDARLRITNGGYLLELSFPELRLTREVSLSTEEFAVLCEESDSLSRLQPS